MSYDRPELDEGKVQREAENIAKVVQEIGKVVVGQTGIIRRLISAMIAQGHVLLEGLPGLAKTTLVKSIAEAGALHFKRVQFTPDLLPADLIGTQVFDPRNQNFIVKHGPIFAHLILADEINRAPAKVQSALLEAMEEKQVTIGDKSWPLEEPFLVMATQNPIEQEGTYPLPEAQLDRFLFKLKITYPTMEEEQEVVRRATTRSDVKIQKVISREEFIELRKMVDKIYVSDKIRRYIVDLVFTSRAPKDRGMKDLAQWIESGASPRASLALDKVARVNALMEGRTFVNPQDIKDCGLDILRHRIRLSYEAQAASVTEDDVIKQIFERVDVP